MGIPSSPHPRMHCTSLATSPYFLCSIETRWPPCDRHGQAFLNKKVSKQYISSVSTPLLHVFVGKTTEHHCKLFTTVFCAWTVNSARKKGRIWSLPVMRQEAIVWNLVIITGKFVRRGIPAINPSSMYVTTISGLHGNQRFWRKP